MTIALICLSVLAALGALVGFSLYLERRQFAAGSRRFL